MNTVEDLRFEKDIFFSFKPEVTTSTIIALEKVCFPLDIEKEKEKELMF